MRTFQNDGSILVLQYNWEENIRQDEKAWAYFKKLNEKSIDGFSGDGIFNVVSQKQRSITICHVPTNRRIRFVCPYKIFQEIHKKSIISLDVTKSGLAVSVSIDNEMNVWETEDGTVRRNLSGHLFDIYSCSMFPSGIVILSGGADMLLKVWDVATGVCPVTLQGHKSWINDTAIIDKGRNIISVSNDGTACLWNCAESKCLATLLTHESEINCCCVTDVRNEIILPEDNTMTEELEYETRGKLLALGCEDGNVFLIAVGGRKTLANYDLKSSVMSLCWTKDFRLLVGLQNGIIMTIDPKEPDEDPLMLCYDSASSVLCIKLLLDGFVISRMDGISQYYLMNGSSPAQFTGPNCDPVYSMACDETFLYTACRDSFIRKYRILDLQDVI